MAGSAWAAWVPPDVGRRRAALRTRPERHTQRILVCLTPSGQLARLAFLVRGGSRRITVRFRPAVISVINRRNRFSFCYPVACRGAANKSSPLTGRSTSKLQSQPHIDEAGAAALGPEAIVLRGYDTNLSRD